MDPAVDAPVGVAVDTARGKGQSLSGPLDHQDRTEPRDVEQALQILRIRASVVYLVYKRGLLGAKDRRCLVQLGVRCLHGVAR